MVYVYSLSCFHLSIDLMRFVKNTRGFRFLGCITGIMGLLVSVIKVCFHWSMVAEMVSACLFFFHLSICAVAAIWLKEVCSCGRCSRERAALQQLRRSGCTPACCTVAAIRWLPERSNAMDTSSLCHLRQQNFNNGTDSPIVHAIILRGCCYLLQKSSGCDGPHLRVQGTQVELPAPWLTERSWGSRKPFLPACVLTASGTAGLHCCAFLQLPQTSPCNS